MAKKEFRKSFLCITIVLALMLFMVFAYGGAAYATDSHPGNATWVEPSTLAFSSSSVNVGDKFNVTLWANMSSSTFTWQIGLKFNATQIQAVRASYTGVGKSEFFAGHSNIPVVAVIDNVTGSVIFGESLVGADAVAPSSGTLCWIEFQIMAAPTSGALSSVLNITNADTFWLDATTLDFVVPSLVTYNADFIYAQSLIVENPTQIPATNVQPNQTVVVSVNVTDTGSGIQNVTLLYTTDNTNWDSVSMVLNSTTNLWDGTIPGKPAGTNAQYKIVAYDNLDMVRTNDNGGAYFVYTVVPEFALIMIFVLMALSTVTLIGFRKKLIR